MKLMFMGTPEFAAVSLEALIKNGEDVSYYIPESVNRYIKEHRLYV